VKRETSVTLDPYQGQWPEVKKKLGNRQVNQRRALSPTTTDNRYMLKRGRKRGGGGAWGRPDSEKDRGDVPCCSNSPASCGNLTQSAVGEKGLLRKA